MIVLLAAFALASSVCSCSNPLWCERLSTNPSFEVFGFSTNASNVAYYNYSILTTISPTYLPTEEFLCLAHSNNVRVEPLVAFPTAQLGNISAVNLFIEQLISDAKYSFYDGINVDIEGVLSEVQAPLLTKLVTNVNKQMKALFGKSFRVSFDVAWSPNCIDGRCYNYGALADVTDFLFIMAYDVQSQVFTENCIANANSPLYRVIQGIEDYVGLGIMPNKLVLGVPWYGFMYQCLSTTNNQTITCPIAHVEFRNCNCSDAAGTYISIESVYSHWLHNSTTGLVWSENASSPYFDLVVSGSVNQVWFDNPFSLAMKYQLAPLMGLRGVGMWELDQINYPPNALSVQMWNTLMQFKGAPKK